MALQTVFKRYELKYLLTREQKKKILEAMAQYMEIDKYGLVTIRNIYFDTDSYMLIRRSIEKPASLSAYVIVLGSSSSSIESTASTTATLDGNGVSWS